MAEIKLNKTELKNQKTLLEQLTKYLPTLQLKKQQLQMEVETARNQVHRLEEDLEQRRRSIAEWSILFSQRLTIDMFDYIELDKVTTETENVAGVDVPFFTGISFKERHYSFFIMPVWLDRAVKELRELITVREQIKVARRRLDLLAEELRLTNIKVNLFEKRLIPACRENIRRIKIFLGDQEIAAICNAKIAKGKLKRKAEEERAEAAA